MRTCEEVRAHLGGYVLDGLEPDEARRVGEHLGACRSCAAEADELATLPGLLGLLEEEAPSQPPEAVRARVLADARRNTRARRRVVGLAAALLAAVAVGGAVLALVGNDGPAETFGDQEQSTTALQAGEGSDASGTLTLSSSGSGLLVEVEATGLEPLPSRGVHEAWLRRPDREQPVSIGRFERGPGGTAAVTFTAAGSREDYDGFWITAEPDAGDPAHQGPTVLWADIR